jgi:hypothetical protein
LQDVTDLAVVVSQVVVLHDLVVCVQKVHDSVTDPQKRVSRNPVIRTPHPSTRSMTAVPVLLTRVAPAVRVLLAPVTGCPPKVGRWP